MAPPIPTSLGQNNDDASSATITLALTGPVPVGEWILVNVGSNIVGNSLSSVTDTHSNAYQIDVSSTGATNANFWIVSCRVTTALVTGDVITATFGNAATTHKLICADRIAGLVTPGWLDKTSTGSGTDVNWNTGATASTSWAPALVYGGSFNNSSSPETSTPAAGQTEVHDFNSAAALNMTICYRLPGLNGADSLTGTWSGSASENRKDGVAVYKIAPEPSYKPGL